jgi:hypothetical protein
MCGQAFCPIEAIEASMLWPRKLARRCLDKYSTIVLQHGIVLKVLRKLRSTVQINLGVSDFSEEGPSPNPSPPWKVRR